MKLAVYPGMYVPHVGGLETHVDELVKHLSTEYDITVVAPRIPSTAPLQEMRHGNVQILRYPAWEVVQHFPVPNIFSKQFWKCIIKSDVYMTRTRFFPNSLLGFIVSKMYGRPNVHVEHGSAHVTSSNKFINFIGRLIDHTYGRLIVQYSKECISISQTVQTFIAKVWKRNTKIIRRGIEPVCPARKNQYEFVFVGRFVAWKGIFNLIEAFKGSPHKLDVFGYGQDQKQIEHITHDLPNITVHGKVSHAQAMKIKASAKYYVHSSLPGGGLSSSLMEALWVGTPALATPNEGANEVITIQNGLLLKDHSVESLKEGIQKIVKMEFNENKIKAAAHQEFSWVESVEQYKTVLNSINL